MRQIWVGAQCIAPLQGIYLNLTDYPTIQDRYMDQSRSNKRISAFVPVEISICGWLLIATPSPACKL